jgi:hypothetical protein
MKIRESARGVHTRLSTGVSTNLRAGFAEGKND